MPKQTSRRIRKYRHYKPKNLGVVRINGIDEYLGKYNAPESLERYHRRISEWLADGQSKPAPTKVPDTNGEPLTISELIQKYWEFAKKYYCRDGKPTQELTGMGEAIRPLRRLYDHSNVSDFGPKSLKAVRQDLITDGISRGVTNRRIGRIKRIFKPRRPWGTLGLM
jgi:hypothetical protein